MFPLPFEDAAEIADWANEAAHWCYMKEIIKGSNGKFIPLRLTSRAEAACMVQRIAKPDYEAPAHVDLIPVITGGWNVNEEFGQAAIPEEAKAAFDKAMEGFDGVGYTPVAYLGRQLVAGTNYAILCKAATVAATPKTGLAVMVIYYDLSGEATITNIAEFAF